MDQNITTHITVLMPVYNGERYLRDAIDSILIQTFTDFEFLIINDGSTDNSETIILSYEDSRIRYEKNESNLKLIATLNKGIKLAKGKYIVRMDADDISSPTRIEKQLAFMEKNQEVGLCGSWFTTFGDMQTKICKYKEQHDEILFKMFFQCHFCHPSLIIRKKVFEDLEIPFDLQFIHAEDYELYFRLSTKWKFHNLQESLLKYRIHSSSVSRQNEMIQLKNSLQIRKLFFSLVQTTPTKEELESFEALNYQNYKVVSVSAENLKMLLESMMIVNEKKQVIASSYFDKELKSLWINYCYHKASYKTYRSSQLLFDEKLVQTVNKPKWFLRSILN